jgi:hypothetical protein
MSTDRAQQWSSRFVAAACSWRWDRPSTASAQVADSMLAELVDRARSDFLVACLAGELDTVRGLLEVEPALARRRTGPRDWEPCAGSSPGSWLHLPCCHTCGALRGYQHSSTSSCSRTNDPTAWWPRMRPRSLRCAAGVIDDVRRFGRCSGGGAVGVNGVVKPPASLCAPGQCTGPSPGKGDPAAPRAGKASSRHDQVRVGDVDAANERHG